MAGPLLQSILCPVLIGRDTQFATLTRLLDLARRGQGQIALISGEAGIGKSRLVAEISAQAAQQGLSSRQGRCFETDRTLPYALLLDLLRVQLGEGKLSAKLDNWLTGRRAATGDGEEDKRRWFEELAQWFSPVQPQLLICEDLHWADDLSLEFLSLLARQVAQRPLLLLLTYRPDEGSPALTRLLALLDRQRLATELLLQPLTE